MCALGVLHVSAYFKMQQHPHDDVSYILNDNQHC